MSVESGTVLVVGIGGEQKRRHYRALRGWGYWLIAVASELDNERMLIEFDENMVIPGLDEHINDATIADRIVREVEHRKLSPVAVVSIWEDCTTLAALVAEKLGLPGDLPLAARTAKHKSLLSDALTHSNVPNPGAIRCQSVDDFRMALQDTGIPAILKLDAGSSAAAVFEVQNSQEGSDLVHRIEKSLSCEADYRGIGLGYGTVPILSRKICGSEHDVDVVMADGRLVASFVTDNSPTRPGHFSEVVAMMPSALCDDSQDDLTQVAYNACLAVGFRTGVYNVELILTSDGPQVIDLNGRMGGFYIRDWIFELWGYDILRVLVDLRSGQTIEVVSSDPPNGVITGIMLSPSIHSPRALERAQDLEGEFLAKYPSHRMVLVSLDSCPSSHWAVDEPFANLAVLGPTKLDSVRALQWIQRRILDTSDDFVEDLLRDLLEDAK